MKKSAEAAYREGAKILKAAGHSARLSILQTLADGAKTVGAIQEQVRLSQPNLSQHLSQLKKVGLISSEATGAMRCYYLAKPQFTGDLLGLLGDATGSERTPDRDAVIRSALAGHRGRNDAAPAKKDKKSAKKGRK